MKNKLTQFLFAILFVLLSFFNTLIVSAGEQIIQQEAISFEKCLNVITESSRYQ